MYPCNRAERTLNQVCSETTYRRLFDELWGLSETVKHVVMQLGKLCIVGSHLVQPSALFRDTHWFVKGYGSEIRSETNIAYPRMNFLESVI